jgi:purine-binding chemotaxis protein CheW
MATQASLADEMILVVFRLGADEYALPISAVSEILKAPRLTRMPRASAWVMGVMNLRGRVFPVIDLRRRLGLHEAPQDARTRVMVAEVAGDPLGLLVDEVKEVFRGEKGLFEGTPLLAENATKDYLGGVVSVGDRMILMLDLKRLFGTPDSTPKEGSAA